MTEKRDSSSPSSNWVMSQNDLDFLESMIVSGSVISTKSQLPPDSTNENYLKLYKNMTELNVILQKFSDLHPYIVDLTEIFQAVERSHRRHLTGKPIRYIVPSSYIPSTEEKAIDLTKLIGNLKNKNLIDLT